MKKTLLLAAAILMLCSLSFAQKDKDQGKSAKLTADEVISKHLASIGTPEDLAAVKSRVMIGKGSLSSKMGYDGGLNGTAQLASDDTKVIFAIIFNSTTYPYEKVAFDGKNMTVGMPNGQMSSLGSFLKSRNSIVKEGLLAGALSSSWPLLDIKAKKAKVEYGGLTKIGDRQLYKLKYSSRSDDIKISLYFDAENFHHVLTEYQYTIDTQLGSNSTDIVGQKSYFTLTEQFSDFKMAGKLTLPFTYSITLDKQLPNGSGTTSLYWMMKVAEVYYNEPLDAAVFKVS